MWMAIFAGPSRWARPVLLVWGALLGTCLAQTQGTSGGPAGAAADAPSRTIEAAWLKSHQELTLGRLRAWPERAALRERLERYDSAAAAQVSDPVRLKNETLVYLRRPAGEAEGQLVWRAGLRGRETVVLDEATLRRRTGRPHRLLQALPAPDGKRVALLMQVGTTTAPVLRVLDLASGRSLGADVDRALARGFSWLPDGSGLLVMQQLDEGPALGDALQALWVRVAAVPGSIGGPVGHRVLLHTGSDLGWQPQELPAWQLQPDGRVLLSARHAVTGHLRVWWHADVAALVRSRGEWTRLVDVPPALTALVLKGDRYFALSEAGAPTRRLVSGVLVSAGGPAAEVVELRAPGEEVLTSLAVAADGLYVAARAGAGRHLLLRRGHQSEAAFEEIALPVLGAFNLGAHSAHAEAEGLLLGVDSWTRRRQIFRMGADGRAVNTGLQGQGPHDAPGELLAMENPVDGVPGLTMTLVQRASAQPDGLRPVLLQVMADTPDAPGAGERMFSSALQVWLDLGGVLAALHPVGSSDERWRQVQAAAQTLIQQRWTRPQRLALVGNAGAAATAVLAAVERPTQFAALVVDEGAWEALRQRPALLQWGALASQLGAEAPVLLLSSEAATELAREHAREHALDRLSFLLQRLQWRLPGQAP